jgi:hypothetical protein
VKRERSNSPPRELVDGEETEKTVDKKLKQTTLDPRQVTGQSAQAKQNRREVALEEEEEEALVAQMEAEDKDPGQICVGNCVALGKNGMAEEGEDNIYSAYGTVSYFIAFFLFFLERR